jgi:hypothetical protein
MEWGQQVTACVPLNALTGERRAASAQERL